MTPFRVVFLLLSGLTLAGTSYVALHGYGRQSLDLDTSIRVGSGGSNYSNSRVK